MSNENPNPSTKEKWDFDDWAFTITGIIVGFLLVVPELMYALFDISFLGGGLGEAEILANLEDGTTVWNIQSIRALSPFLFLVTTSLSFIVDAVEARKTGGYKGSLFTHTYESLFEDAIYMSITTFMVFGAVFGGLMAASWLAGPVAWVLFVFIFPLANRNRQKEKDEETRFPWFLLGLFIIGIIIEVITQAWIAFPVAWVAICAIKAVSVVRRGIKDVDEVFNLLYYAFSVILIVAGLLFDFWMTSWLAFPIALFICWVVKKIRNYEKV
ncbi:MAG: hypothetical protein FWC95_06050 [Defluviitaleaceae bacterium]|nr:hypothetical protein [Defluviitaleaceae bacterium]